MNATTRLQVNKASIVYDTFCDETILLDVNSGRFYCLEGAGSVLWQYLMATGTWRAAMEIMIAANSSMHEKIRTSVTGFIESLVASNLVIPGGKSEVPAVIPDLVRKLKTAARNFIPPKISLHDDMKIPLMFSASYYTRVPNEPNWPEGIENQGMILT